VVATDLALKLGEWVVTEAGFASELGAEKFLNIKRKVLGKTPDVVVIVATVRALKHHGDGDLVKGLDNLGAHINNIKNNFCLPTVVCINKFKDDTQEDLDIVQHYAKELADDCVVSNHWAKGSDGALDLACSVINTEKKYGSQPYKYTYSEDDIYSEKIYNVCRHVYGLKDVLLELQIQNKLLEWNRTHPGLPICISKSPKKINPFEKEFVWVDSVELRAGAGYIVVKIGNVITLPGLPEVPSAEVIDVVDGKIVGIN
jgi:formate--tetrahydrofolate ligase